MTEDRSAAVQDDFFHRARREGGIVTIFLTSGKKLTGRIKGFDRFTLILESHHVDQLIFKHAVSTVTMGRPHAETRDVPHVVREEARAGLTDAPRDEDKASAPGQPPTTTTPAS